MGNKSPNREGQADSLPGLYRARIEYNRDAWQAGRCAVRVFNLHGDPDAGGDSYIPTEQLPWARPGLMQGASSDTGTSIVPQVGSLVWVMFEEGDTSKPVYMGGIVTDGASQKMNQVGDFNNSHPDYMGGSWNGTSGPDTPGEVYDGRGKNDDVTRSVLYKSPTGSVIYMDDTDNQENLTIIDRVGQVFQMVCPIPVNDNKGNGKQRGTKSILNDQQLTKEGCYILMKTGDTQVKQEPEVITLSFKDTTFIKLENKKITLSAGNASIVLEDTSDDDGNGGNSTITVDTNNKSTLTVTDDGGAITVKTKDFSAEVGS